MIKQILSLSLVLVLGFVAWSLYEIRSWDQNYTRYPFSTDPIPPFNPSHTPTIDPTYLKTATVITNDTHLRYPQDLAVSSQGVIYSGLCDGSIVSVTPESNATTTLIHHKESGRIYGIIITSDDSTLYYASEFMGLIKLNLQTLESTVLLREMEGRKLGALNSICIDQQKQIIYVTQSSPIRMTFSSKQMLLGHKAGRVLSFDLNSGRSAVVLDEIAFPNGIVYEAKTNSIIFAELTRFKIWKYRLTDNKKQLLVDNLFGFPDNLKLTDDGFLTVGIPSVRDQFTDLLNSQVFLRKLMMYLPERLMYSLVKKYAGGIKVDTSSGEIVKYMFGAPMKTSFVTTVLEKKGKTYFASLRSPTIIVLQGKASTSANADENPVKEDL